MESKMKILVIDDETEITSMIKDLFENEGFIVLTANDGAAGLDMMRKELPDLIILDLAMPKLSGEELCKAMRKDPNPFISNIPIIMLTAKSTDLDRILGIVLGANAYMTKPFKQDDLLNLVLKHLPGIK
ncbi:MAG: hypothetical protein A3G33_06280 [Omnitrophica bacterium RIFCSPLOWO2_12_FULL_44_17]|uniref:Response regulatory domain-containing protein n=1 Tax=Candidatus Danuiimicrobium aquiferis TaxID=1801832 RepID=A0A1G1KVH0_9BACT|nr:MAG: hypothetical protein A3B72_04825 [Omnitrophica bacterium RIFCSPHIGHO2_02_FULL_45_28]OGW96891.1 MAG: hypothetical protein A3G33_06280 [Omnitrophica bacterium RIFCSPLOWO2_12_FULL_44_17]OGX02424.1 MAG: hypothetical protein A3J12_05025 [Omnitrophica bacterium RIFCSPLOWO2_02_FULL_44_11]